MRFVRRPLVIGSALALVAGIVLAVTLQQRSQPADTPSEVIDLSNWKLTVPVDTSHAGEPDEIKQPELAGYRSRYFGLNQARNGVTFRAHAGGEIIAGSDYPRSELRQMTANGTAQAAWSSRHRTHSMTVRESINHLPSGKSSVVAGQIHDEEAYVMLVRLDGNELYVKADDEIVGVLDSDYVLGEVFDLKVVSQGTHVKVYYNGMLKVDLWRECTGCYFKIGAYLQSNTEWDKKHAFAEVTVYDLRIGQ